MCKNGAFNTDNLVEHMDLRINNKRVVFLTQISALMLWDKNQTVKVFGDKSIVSITLPIGSMSESKTPISVGYNENIYTKININSNANTYLNGVSLIEDVYISMIRITTEKPEDVSVLYKTVSELKDKHEHYRFESNETKLTKINLSVYDDIITKVYVCITSVTGNDAVILSKDLKNMPLLKMQLNLGTYKVANYSEIMPINNMKIGENYVVYMVLLDTAYDIDMKEDKKIRCSAKSFDNMQILLEFDKVSDSAYKFIIDVVVSTKTFL